MQLRSKSPWLWMGIGLSIGLVMGVGMLVGALVAFSYSGPERTAIQFPETALHASATHGTENFSIATGMVADGVEGIFFLDNVTGELQCQVINRRTGTLAAQYQQFVFPDLKLEAGKKPRLLMVTGTAPFSRGSGSVRLGDSVVYIADATSGHFVAYSLPWNQNLVASRRPQISQMVRVGAGSVRQQIVRD